MHVTPRYHAPLGDRWQKLLESKMIRIRIVAGMAASLTLAATPLVTSPLLAQQGMGMMGTGGDTATTAIMRVVHELMTNHDKLRRTVTNLPNGIRTLTESDDPTMASSLKAHVARTSALVSKGEDPNLPMSTPSLHGVLRNGARITRVTKETAKGVAVTETSDDPATVALMQQRAAEVTDLVNRGMAAMHETMMKSGGMMSGGMSGASMPGMTHDTSAAAFAALQERGKQAMGVDQYTSTHHFDDMTDGGRIELQRDGDNSIDVAQIRGHLQEIASAFKGGDFTTPAFVHMQSVPGAAVMAAKRSAISYTYSALPRGGQLLIVSKDKDAIAAIHEFLAFQRMDHRTP